MTVHLVKMAVGVSSVEHLQNMQEKCLADNNGILRHFTRNKPKRFHELLDGGSIFWIIKGYIRVKQRICGFDEIFDRTKKRRCIISLDPKLVRVEMLAHKPIQGWRYMEDNFAPAAINSEYDACIDGFPDTMVNELKSLGLL